MSTAAKLLSLHLLLVLADYNDGKSKVNKKFGTGVNATSFIWKQSVVKLTFVKVEATGTAYIATGFLASTKLNEQMVIVTTASLFVQETKVDFITKAFDAEERFFHVTWGEKLIVDFGSTEADSNLKYFDVPISAKKIKIPSRYSEYNDEASPFNVAIVSLTDEQINQLKAAKCQPLQLNPFHNKEDSLLSSPPGVRCLIAGWSLTTSAKMSSYLWKSSEGCDLDGKIVCLKSENPAEKASLGDYGAPIFCAIETNNRIISMLSGVCADCSSQPQQHIYGIRPDFLRALLMP